MITVKKETKTEPDKEGTITKKAIKMYDQLLRKVVEIFEAQDLEK